MKKIYLIIGILFASVFFMTDTTAHASVSGSAIVTDEEIEQDGTKDGINDNTDVNFRSEKISDKNILLENKSSIFGPGRWDYIGSSKFRTQSKTFSSGGGDLKIYIYQPDLGPRN